jgi:hypothetical protein
LNNLQFLPINRGVANAPSSTGLEIPSAQTEAYGDAARRYASREKSAIGAALLKRHPDIIHDAMQAPAVRENIHTCRQGSQAACAANLTQIGVKSKTGITCLNIYCNLIPQRFAMTINYL